MQNYDLNNTGPEVQERLDQVPVTQQELTEEVQNRIEGDAAVTQDCKDYTDAETLRAQQAEAAELERAQGVENSLQSQINEIVSKDATVSLVTRNAGGSAISAIFVGETTPVTILATCSPAAASKNGVPGIRIFRENVAVDGGTKDAGTSHSATVDETPAAATTIHYSAKFFISGLERTATRNLSAVDKIYYGEGVETIEDYAEFAASISHKAPQVNTVGEYPFTTTEEHRYIYILVPTTMPAIVLSNVYLGKNSFNLLLLTSEAEIDDISYRVYRCVNAQQVTSYTISIVS